MNNRENLFQFPAYIKKERPLTIMIHSDSIAEEILSGSSAVDKLCHLNDFDEIAIYFSPTKNEALKSKIKHNWDCDVGEYNLNDKFVVYKHPELSLVVMMLHGQDYEDQIKKNNDSNLCNIDIALLDDNFEEFDYVVLSGSDLDKFQKSKKAISTSGAMEHIRLFMLNQKLFYVHKHYSIDEFWYYIYRYKKVFSQYQRIWSIALNHPDLEKWAMSLSQRFEFYCMAIDQVKIECLRPSNNLTASYIKYNLGYLIIIMIGIFDNLAWLLKYTYSIEVDKREVGLKIPMKKLKQNKTTAFLEGLSLHNSDLADFISMPNSQKCIHLLYPIRDALAHREFFQSAHYTNNSEKISTNIIRVPDEIYDDFKDLLEQNKSLDCFFRFPDIAGGRVFIEPYKFIEIVDKLFTDLINDIMQRIDFSAHLQTLPEDERAQISDSMRKYDLGLYKFLNLHVEPLYF